MDDDTCGCGRTITAGKFRFEAAAQLIWWLSYSHRKPYRYPVLAGERNQHQSQGCYASEGHGRNCR